MMMIRLYANIFAGHIVLMSIIGLMFILKAGWEVVYLWIVVCTFHAYIVAFLQAYIFYMLSAFVLQFSGRRTSS
jgi:F-type H+-transporting ATPase subunit a